MDKAKYLVVTIYKRLSWKTTSEPSQRRPKTVLTFCRGTWKNVIRKLISSATKRLSAPFLSNASPVWDPVDNKKLQYRLEQVQRKSIRWSCNKWQHDIHADDLLQKTHYLQTLKTRRQIKRSKMLFRFYHGNKFLRPDMMPAR